MPPVIPPGQTIHAYDDFLFPSDAHETAMRILKRGRFSRMTIWSPVSIGRGR
jgi:hypothetical protein